MSFTPWGRPGDFYNASERACCNGSNGFAVVASVCKPAGAEYFGLSSVPVFAKLTWNPRTEITVFVFGLKFLKVDVLVK